MALIYPFILLCALSASQTLPQPEDDYYSKKNGKYLGRDGSTTGHPRLIDEKVFFAWRNDPIGDEKQLAKESEVITIDDDQIQEHLQKVRDLSMRGLEYQMYIILDLKKATVTSILSDPGTNNKSYFEYYPAPGLGANMPVGTNGRRITFTVILAAAHGHPDSDMPMITTLPTMSPDRDVATARNRRVAIYGVDAMSTTGLPGSAGRIHRANPDGTIDNNVGWTRGTGPATFNIGLDALTIWGRSQVPLF